MSDGGCQSGEAGRSHLLYPGEELGRRSGERGAEGAEDEECVRCSGLSSAVFGAESALGVVKKSANHCSSIIYDVSKLSCKTLIVCHTQ